LVKALEEIKVPLRSAPFQFDAAQMEIYQSVQKMLCKKKKDFPSSLPNNPIHYDNYYDDGYDDIDCRMPVQPHSRYDCQDHCFEANFHDDRIIRDEFPTKRDKIMRMTKLIIPSCLSNMVTMMTEIINLIVVGHLQNAAMVAGVGMGNAT